MLQSEHTKEIHLAEWVAHYRQHNLAADRWAAGYGPIQHTLETQTRVMMMAEALAVRGTRGDGVPLLELLYAAGRVASAATGVDRPRQHPTALDLDGGSLLSFCVYRLLETPQ